MPLQDTIYHFGPYELRTRTREVYKNGKRLKLRRQPFQVLRALVERSGDVVTREELQQLLWPAEMFVDFEHGLNTAIKELRGVLNDSANEPRYIETLPKLGYRILVPVESSFATPQKNAESIASGAVAENMELASGSTFGLRGVAGWRRWPIAVAAAVVLLAGVTATVQWLRSRAHRAAPVGRAMLAVLPFENLTGDASQDYFSDGLTEEMIAQLGRLDPQHLGVIARTSVMHYKHSQDSLEQIGRELGVQYVLEGSFRRDAGQVRISAQLIQVKDQTHLWSRQYDRELSGLLALQAEIAQEIADEIQLTLGNRRQGVARASVTAPQASYEAYDLYLRGRYSWNKRTSEGFQQAADYFERAIAVDPNYARAYAGLADTFSLMSTWSQVPANEFMPKARMAALKALQIDENQAEAHTSLALIAEHYDYDWQTAEKEFRRAIQIDPDYATAHQWYAECLGFEGRFEEAFAESERARQLDPLSLIIATDHGALLLYSRQYDHAIEQFRTVLDMNPDFPRAHLLIQAYLEKGMMAEAAADVEEIKRRWGENAWYWSALAEVYGRWGRMPEARHAFAKLKEQLERHKELDPTIYLLGPFVGMGRNEEAMGVLQHRFAEHIHSLAELKVNPFYDPLRSDPRFQDLLRRVGLAEPPGHAGDESRPAQ